MIRVMLVDDHQMVRAGIRRFLEKADDIHVVAEAGDAAEATMLMREQMPDVAVVDIKLPDSSGIELARQLRASANGYLLKSAAPADVIAGVRRAADGEQVQADFDEGARLGVRGTPSFFINGQFISGAQPFDVFGQAIEQALQGR